MADPIVLVLNSGSSSLKVAFFRLATDGEIRIADGNTQGTAATTESIFEKIADGRYPMPDAVGHRLVHGGPRHVMPERIGPALVASLREALPFAPLHLPAELLGIETMAARYPNVPQVACFDTAFHHGLPEVAQRFALPRALFDEGVKRYGFHGLSYEYIVRKLGTALGARSIILHLGNGASMVALQNGKPIDTTMGFTPAGGFMMGTRSGDLDPGVLVYLARAGRNAGDLETIVNHQSGLLGVSGTTSDMKDLLERRASDPHAALAFEMFCYQARKAVGSFGAALGGLDTLVFTGGIGERASSVRERICAGLEFMGVRIDRARNGDASEVISPPDCPVTVRVCATDEEITIARHTRRLVFPQSHPTSRVSP